MTVSLRNLEAGEWLHQTPESHTAAVRSLTYSPDGRYIASGSMDYSVLLWDAITGQQLHKFTGFKGWADAVVFSANGQYLASLDNEIAHVWNVSTKEKVMQLPIAAGNGRQIPCLAITPDSRQLALGLGNSLKIYDIETGEEHLKYDHYKKPVKQIGFSSDGKNMMVASEDGIIQITDFATNNELFKIEESAGFGAYNEIAFSPDGRYISWCSPGPRISIDSPDGSKYYHVSNLPLTANLIELKNSFPANYFKLVGHLGWIRQLAFLPAQIPFPLC